MRRTLRLSDICISHQVGEDRRGMPRRPRREIMLLRARRLGDAAPATAPSKAGDDRTGPAPARMATSITVRTLGSNSRLSRRAQFHPFHEVFEQLIAVGLRDHLGALDRAVARGE